MSKLVQIGILLVLFVHTSIGTWEFAVSTNSKIILYDELWREIKTTAHQYSDLWAIAFDETAEVIYFNDRGQHNGSIFSVRVPLDDNKQHVYEQMVQRTGDEIIAGLAYDPLNRTLFWSDKNNKKIYYMSMDDNENRNAARNDAIEPKIFMDFSGTGIIPDGIAIDVCRRQLYWTNSNFKNASIERINLNGNDRQLIVHGQMYLPHGIVVDQLTDRIYWVDDQEGVHYTVESANFDGTQRNVLVSGAQGIPSYLHVTMDEVFWTDVTNDMVWSYSKYHQTEQLTNDTNTTSKTTTTTTPTTPTTTAAVPHQVHHFDETPHGIVGRTHFLSKLQNDPQCRNVVQQIRDHVLTPKPTQNPIDARITELERDYCLNGGVYSDRSGVCVCQMGFKGVRCETNECTNFCVHGSCSMSSMGFPMCTCQHGFNGARCQSHKCTGYCMNDGQCLLGGSDDDETTCKCKENFGGERCEKNSTEICSLFCRLLKHEPKIYVPLGCHDICDMLAKQSNTEMYALPNYEHLEVCRTATVMTETVVIILIVGVVLCLGLIALIVNGLRRFYKPLRPRIKKTFVVRKQATGALSSDTPLTNRPMATEQCEITIENCCNMNICDTPCFDPKLVQQSLSRDVNTKEDKKILIHSMDDELY